MGDVLEYIVDGTSGLVTGSVGGCIVAGVCSKGEPGKGYLLGNRSDVEGILGVGTLTTRVKDMFMTGGQNPLVIAVPVQTDIAGMIGAVHKPSMSAPAVSVTGEAKTDGLYAVEILSTGGRNTGTFTLRGGEERTIPADGVYTFEGLTITFPDETFVEGDIYTFSTTAPQATIASVMEAIEKPLELYDVEFVYITGASDSVAWTACQAKAEELFNLHRPTYFKLEARLPNSGEDINDWTAELVAEAKEFAGRWVQICAQYGNVTDSKGLTATRNWGGLQAGKTLALPVQRAHGRVRDGNISQGKLANEWNSAVQETLEKAGYLTAKTYAGLSGAYWGDSRTMADATSDYQYEEVVQITLPQGPAVNITDISYSDGQAIGVRYGKGGVPLGYGRQNYEASGSMTLDLEEWERLTMMLGNPIYDHEPFSIIVSYGDAGFGTITDKLSKVKITKASTSNSQGSENAGAKSLEFTILEPISYNGKVGK